MEKQQTFTSVNLQLYKVIVTVSTLLEELYLVTSHKRVHLWALCLSTLTDYLLNIQCAQWVSETAEDPGHIVNTVDLFGRVDLMQTVQNNQSIVFEEKKNKVVDIF